MVFVRGRKPAAEREECFCDWFYKATGLKVPDGIADTAIDMLRFIRGEGIVTAGELIGQKPGGTWREIPDDDFLLDITANRFLVERHARILGAFQALVDVPDAICRVWTEPGMREKYYCNTAPAFEIGPAGETLLALQDLLDRDEGEMHEAPRFEPVRPVRLADPVPEETVGAST